jgi:hypothetical protein
MTWETHNEVFEALLEEYGVCDGSSFSSDEEVAEKKRKWQERYLMAECDR